MPPAASPSLPSTLDPRLALPETDAGWRKLMGLLPGYDPWRGIDGTGLWFNPKEARRAIEFFHEMLTHAEGELAGTPFLLGDWQKAYIGNLFGWMRSDGTRRYRESMLFVPRKNGKTPLVAGICLFVLVCDGETGAQIYSAAADKEQAALLFRQAAGMVRNNAELDADQGGIVQVYGGMTRRSLVYESRMSAYRALSSDAKTKHGLTPSLAAIDEEHALPDRELVDTLSTGMASKNRKNPLLIHVTTSDYDRPSICNEKHEYACKVRDGETGDLYFLPAIWEADRDADWTLESVWEKANPNLDVSVSREYLRAECEKAKTNPALENTFRRLHLNQKTTTDVRWMPLREWDESSGGGVHNPARWREITTQALKGEPCVLGLDLSQKIDITALVAVFPPHGSRDWWCVLPWFWVPGDNARKRERADRVPYAAWAREGFVEMTGGNWVDYEPIKARVRACCDQFDVRELAYDPWGAEAIGQDLERDGMVICRVRQGVASLSEPMKEMYGQVLARKFYHGGNPVLRWMVGNTAAKIDDNGNIKPDKAKSTERIDGVSATITAMARALVIDVSGGSWGSVGFVGL